MLQAERLGHDEPGMRGVYGHVSDPVRDEIKGALEARWRQSLYERSPVLAGVACPFLNRLLASMGESAPAVGRTPLVARGMQRRRGR